MTSSPDLFRRETPDDRVTRIWFDTPGRPVNLLSRPVLEELDRQLQESERIGRPVLLQSGKRANFCAGADLKWLASIRTDQEIDAFLEVGLAVLDRLDRMSVPTVAILRGTCLGGGLELALACHYRIVVDEPATHLGMPETHLELIPGWGGIQRLSRQIAPEIALEMLLTGEPCPAARSVAIGLVDRLVSPEDEARLVDIALDTIAAVGPRESPLTAVTGRAALLPADEFRDGAESAARGAIRMALAAGWNDPEAGLRAERRLFRDLLRSPECQSRLAAFLSHHGHP